MNIKISLQLMSLIQIDWQIRAWKWGMMARHFPPSDFYPNSVWFVDRAKLLRHYARQSLDSRIMPPLLRMKKKRMQMWGCLHQRDSCC